MRLSVEQILKSVHIAYEQATDAPALNDEDGKIRLDLLGKGVQRWASDNTTRWDELWSIETIGPIEAGVTEYDLPEGFTLAEAFYLQGSRKPMAVKKITDVTGEEGKFVYRIGNPRTGYKLRLGWTPAEGDQEVGKTITVTFYREPFIPTATTDYVEMSDPQFLVSYITSELFVSDDPDLYGKFNADALLSLANMRERNDQTVVGESTGIGNQDGDDDDIPFGC